MESENEAPEPKRSPRKVQYIFCKRKKRIVALPLIRLSGYYLAEYGFGIGDEINVAYEKGRITITKTLEFHQCEKPG